MEHGNSVTLRLLQQTVVGKVSFIDYWGMASKIKDILIWLYLPNPRETAKFIGRDNGSPKDPTKTHLGPYFIILPVLPEQMG